METKNQVNQAIQQDECYLRLLMGNQTKIYAFILSMVQNSNDADDIMQDTITFMWRHFSEYIPGTSFVAWGITIARNLVLKFYEKNRHSRLSFTPDIGKKIDLIASEKINADENRIEALRNCLRKIGVQNYELLRLRYVKNIPTRTIAIERGIAPHTMYRMMGKIHETLLGCIKRTQLGSGV